MEDEESEISVGDARAINPKYNEAGDVLETEVTPRDFGRIAAQTAKQVVVQRIRGAGTRYYLRSIFRKGK